MKHLTKAFALVLAAIMAMVMSIPAFAAVGDQLAAPEDTITATNVVAGDSVEYYHLVEWNNGDWALTTLGSSCGVSLADLVDGITETEAATIATSLATSTKTGDMVVDTTDTTGTTFIKTPVAAGLYYLKAIPAADNEDTIYNPAFVSADYREGGNTVSFSSAYANTTILKKSDVSIEKEVNSQTDDFVDVKPGDVIPFKVTTKIPTYGNSYTNPVFNITDELSEGLAIEGNVTVKYGNVTTTQTNDDVAITTSASGYTVEFKEAYLKGLNGANPDVEITYSAKVTTDALNNVTYMDNKAKLTFSNTPTTTKDKDDITRHYTFSIDGDILGQKEKEGSELIKTAMKDGEPVFTETQTFHETTVSVLAGASFKLVGTGDNAGVTKTVNSDANGRIKFQGLRAGTYTLTEESAPTGFVKDSRTFTVTITPTYDTTITDLLVSYTITITAPASGDTPAYNGSASFTMTNDGGKTSSSTIESNSNFINNTPGVELPSTGGMGTRLFYIIGGLLVIGGGVALVTKQRMAKIEG